MKWFSEVILKFMLSKKATKIDEIFNVDLTLCSKCQIHDEDFVNFCGLLRKHELYSPIVFLSHEYVIAKLTTILCIVKDLAPLIPFYV